MSVVPEAFFLFFYNNVSFSTEKVQKREPQQQIPEPLKGSRKRDLGDATSIQITAQDPESVMTPFPFLCSLARRDV